MSLDIESVTDKSRYRSATHEESAVLSAVFKFLQEYRSRNSFLVDSFHGVCNYGFFRSFCKLAGTRMHPHLTIHRHPMCADIIEEFQKCHIDHPLGKFFGHCTDLKIKLDRCFREEKAVKRKANFEESKKMKERLRDQRKENARDER